jgi:hypothetical protein
LLPAQADEAKQAAFIAKYEALMNGLAADEMVVFSDAVHPEHQSRPAHGWFPKGQKTALKATSGRKQLNIQGALDLETFQFTFVEGEKINARQPDRCWKSWNATTKPRRPSTSLSTMPAIIMPRYYSHGWTAQNVG